MRETDAGQMRLNAGLPSTHSHSHSHSYGLREACAALPVQAYLDKSAPG